MTAFKNVKLGTWTGGTGGDCRLNQLCDMPAVHLTRKGSNSAYTGFNTLLEAFMFRRRLRDRTEWRIVDLRGVAGKSGAVSATLH